MNKFLEMTNSLRNTPKRYALLAILNTPLLAACPPDPAQDTNASDAINTSSTSLVLEGSTGTTQAETTPTSSDATLEEISTGQEGTTGHASSGHESGGIGQGETTQDSGDTTSTTGDASSTTGGTEDSGETSGTTDDEICYDGLGIEYQANPESAILIAGTTHQHVSSLLLKAYGQDYIVNTLTMTNDLEGPLGDTPIVTPAIKQICIDYTDQDQNLDTACAPFAKKEATFTGLDLYVPNNGKALLTAYSDLASMQVIGPTLSGEKIRIGLKTKDNSETFEAIGQSDKKIIDLEGDECVSVTNVQNVPTFVIRQNKPVFADSPTPTPLLNGISDLIRTHIISDGEAIGELGRLTYKIDLQEADKGGQLFLKDFSFRRQLPGLPAVLNANIRRGSDGANIIKGGAILKADDTVIVTLNEPETIDTFFGADYALTASIYGVGVNDRVVTQLLPDDKELTGIDAEATTPNTGKVYVKENVNAGIFSVEPHDYSQKMELGKSFIWSDYSAWGQHQYPTVLNGAVLSDSGSNDFTNGHLLNINQLKPHTLDENN